MKNEKKENVEFIIPDGLTELESKHYKSLYDDLNDRGIDSHEFRRSLLAMAKLYAIEERLSLQIDEEGFTTIGANGVVKEHPASKLLMGTKYQIYSFLKEFGLTPSAKERAKIKYSKINEDNPFNGF